MWTSSDGRLGHWRGSIGYAADRAYAYPGGAALRFDEARSWRIERTRVARANVSLAGGCASLANASFFNDRYRRLARRFGT